jgi:hypothetical protein
LHIAFYSYFVTWYHKSDRFIHPYIHWPYTDSMQQFKRDTEYKPQQSTRISATDITSDNDTWTEYLTIVEVPRRDKRNTFELQVRSFFESKATGEKVWGEPPTGATRIFWATEEMKQMAHEQMCDLMAVDTTTQAGEGGLKDDDDDDEKDEEGKEEEEEEKGRGHGEQSKPSRRQEEEGCAVDPNVQHHDSVLKQTTLGGHPPKNQRKGNQLWGRFISFVIPTTSKKKQQQLQLQNTQQGVDRPKSLPRKLVYRQGSKTDMFSKGMDGLTSSCNWNEQEQGYGYSGHGHGHENSHGQQKKVGQKSINLEDVNLQLAMALSLEQQEQDKSKKSCGTDDRNNISHEESQDIEMAKALSLSEVTVMDNIDTVQVQDNCSCNEV